MAEFGVDILAASIRSEVTVNADPVVKRNIMTRQNRKGPYKGQSTVIPAVTHRATSGRMDKISTRITSPILAELLVFIRLL